MTEMKHTPLPWVANGRYIGTPNHMSYVGEVRDESGNWSDTVKSRGDAVFIVRACNSHYDLLDAVQRAEAMIELMRSAAYQVGLEGTKEWDEIVGGSDVQGTYDVILKAIAKAMDGHDHE